MREKQTSRMSLEVRNVVGDWGMSTEREREMREGEREREIEIMSLLS